MTRNSADLMLVTSFYGNKNYIHFLYVCIYIYIVIHVILPFCFSPLQSFDIVAYGEKHNENNYSYGVETFPIIHTVLNATVPASMTYTLCFCLPYLSCFQHLL